MGGVVSAISSVFQTVLSPVLDLVGLSPQQPQIQQAPRPAPVSKPTFVETPKPKPALLDTTAAAATPAEPTVQAAPKDVGFVESAKGVGLAKEAKKKDKDNKARAAIGSRRRSSLFTGTGSKSLLG